MLFYKTQKLCHLWSLLLVFLNFCQKWKYVSFKQIVIQTDIIHWIMDMLLAQIYVRYFFVCFFLCNYQSLLETIGQISLSLLWAGIPNCSMIPTNPMIVYYWCDIYHSYRDWHCNMDEEHFISIRNYCAIFYEELKCTTFLWHLSWMKFPYFLDIYLVKLSKI